MTDGAASAVAFGPVFNETFAGFPESASSPKAGVHHE